MANQKFVLYQGQVHQINSVNLSGVAAPYYRMTNIATGEGVSQTSHQLCTPVYWSETLGKYVTIPE